MLANSFYSSKAGRKQSHRDVLSPINRIKNANKDLDRVDNNEFSESTFENHR
jgi:hypothetical protein